MFNRGIIIHVPFLEKDEAKALGAWWDPDIKKWFVPKGMNTAPFKKWLKENNKEKDAMQNED